jgi:hypothetical protein
MNSPELKLLLNRHELEFQFLSDHGCFWALRKLFQFRNWHSGYFQVLNLIEAEEQAISFILKNIDKKIIQTY